MKNTRGTGLRLLRAAPVLLLLLVPLRLVGQTAQNSGPTSVDDVIKQETYATPPPELADAVLAPRHQNITLSNISPDKKWFLDEIGDGPVADEDVLEAVPRAGRRVRRLQGEPRPRVDHPQQRRHPGHLSRRRHEAAVQIPAGARVSNATWSPDSTRSRTSCTPTTRRTS